MRLGGYHVVCVAIYFPVQRLIGCVPYVGTLARQLWQIDKRQSFGTTGHTLSRPKKNMKREVIGGMLFTHVQRSVT